MQAQADDEFAFPRLSDRRGVAVLVLALSAIPLLFPGDAPFINDEPLLISAAFHANTLHRLAERGLTGTLGVSYGPLPVWIYQLFLLLSHNLVVVVLFRAALVTAVTALSLWWLAQTLKLWPWFAGAIMLSPYLWIYSRILWDNSFCIPVSALGFAAYASFLARKSAFSIFLMLLSLWILLCIHLMSLAFILPIALDLILVNRRDLWHHRWVVTGTTLLATIGGLSYWSYLLKAPRQHYVSGGPASWFFPLLGPRFLSASGLDYFLGADWLNSTGNIAIEVAFLLTLLSFPLTWMGIVVAVRSIATIVRRKQPMSVRDHVGAVALAILLMQILLNGYTGTFGHPHYFNSTWIVFAFFAWISVDTLSNLSRGTWIPAAYAAGLAVVLGLIIGQLHLRGGTREGYGPTLANQREIATKLDQYSPDSPLRVEAVNYSKFPHALATLRLLNSSDPNRTVVRKSLRLVYTSANPKDGRITLAASD